MIRLRFAHSCERQIGLQRDGTELLERSAITLKVGRPIDVELTEQSFHEYDVRSVVRAEVENDKIAVQCRVCAPISGGTTCTWICGRRTASIKAASCLPITSW